MTDIKFDDILRDLYEQRLKEATEKINMNALFKKMLNEIKSEPILDPEYYNFKRYIPEESWNLLEKVYGDVRLEEEEGI